MRLWRKGCRWNVDYGGQDLMSGNGKEDWSFGEGRARFLVGDF